MTDFVEDAKIWPTLRDEAQRDAEREPCLAGFLYESVLRHPTLMDALGGLLSHKLASETMSSMTLLSLAQEAFVLIRKLNQVQLLLQVSFKALLFFRSIFPGKCFCAIQ